MAKEDEHVFKLLDKESGMKGNQFGLSPGDRVALSETTTGQVSDTAWYSNTKVINGTVIGYDQYGYPVVCFDEKHKRSGFALTEMRKSGNQPDAKQFEKIERTVNVAEAGRCFQVYAEAAFRKLDVDGKPVRNDTASIQFGLVAGQKVYVSEENGKINDQRWAGNQLSATVIGCNEEGAPIVMLDQVMSDARYTKLGWPLKNILNEDNTPRVACTVAKSVRQTLSNDTADMATRRCFYVYSKDALRRADGTQIEQLDEAEDTMDVKKNFDLDFGDRVKLSCDSEGVNFDFTEGSDVIYATVIGFRKDDGSPIVMFDNENGQSGWALSDILTKAKKPGANIALDPNLLSKVLASAEKLSGDFTYYIGNAETFRKITTKTKGKGKTSMSNKNDEVETDTTQNKIMTRLKKSGAKVPYRMARMQALTNGKTAILNAVKDRLEPNSFAMLEGILSSDSGAGAILALIGLIGPMMPKVGEDKRVQALCEEFLDEGMAKGTNEVMNLGVAILAPALMSAVAMLPPVAEAVEERAAKKEKKRVAANPEPEEAEEEQEEEEAASEGKRLSAK